MFMNIQFCVRQILENCIGYALFNTLIKYTLIKISMSFETFFMLSLPEMIDAISKLLKLFQKKKV